MKTDLVTVAINSQTSKTGRSDWKYFRIDASTQETLFKHSFSHLSGKGKVVLSDDQARDIATDRFELAANDFPGEQRLAFPITLITALGVDNSSHRTIIANGAVPGQNAITPIFLISPLFFERNVYMRVRPSLRVFRDIDLTLDELKSVKDIKCELSFGD